MINQLSNKEILNNHISKNYNSYLQYAKKIKRNENYEDAVNDILLEKLSESDKNILRYVNMIANNKFNHYIHRSIYYRIISKKSSFNIEEKHNSHISFEHFKNIDKLLKDASLIESSSKEFYDNLIEVQEFIIDNLLNESKCKQYGIEWFEARLYKDYALHKKTFKQLAHDYKLSHQMVYYQFNLTKNKIILIIKNKYDETNN